MPEQNFKHFADNIYEGIFLNFCILIKISLEFIFKGQIYN